MKYGIYETRKAAEDAAGADAVMQVDGGFQVMDWSDYHQSSRDEAEALYAGGWRSNDKEELMEQYNIDEEHADLMISIIEDLESMAEYKIKDGLSNEIIDELGSEVNDDTVWTYEDVKADAENYGMTPGEFINRYLEELI